jgi:parvulin-like peptidyl-prolyl isomerase
MKSRLYAFCAVFCAIVPVSGALFAQTTDTGSKNPLQPVVMFTLPKTSVIGGSEFDKTVGPASASLGAGARLSDTQKSLLLQSMIDQKVVLLAAEQAKVTVDSEINQQMNEVKTQLSATLGHQSTDAEFAEVLRAQTGMDMATYRETMKRQLTIQKYIATQKPQEIEKMRAAAQGWAESGKGTDPTEAEIQKYYNMNKASQPVLRPDSAIFTMVLVPFGDDKAKAKATADGIARTIGRDPEQFTEQSNILLASRRQDVTVQQSAQLFRSSTGWVPLNGQVAQMIGEDVVDAIRNLKQGQVSDLIAGPAYYTIVLVDRKSSQKLLGLDEVDIFTGTTIRMYIVQALFQQKQQEIANSVVDDLRKKAKYQVMTNNLNFTWQPPKP